MVEQVEQVDRQDRAYSKFLRDLQYWRGQQLRLYYARLENPMIRRRSTKTQSRQDLLDQLKRCSCKRG